MIKATIEIDNGTHVVLLQDEEGNKMVTSVLPLLDMIKSGKDILVEGDNVVAGKVKDYIINLKENLDILEDIKEMAGKEPETVIPVNFMNKATLEGHVLKLDCNPVSRTPTIDKCFNPSSDVIDKMNEANEPMLKLKSNNGRINHFLKGDFMTLQGRRGNVRSSEEGVYRLVFEDEEDHVVTLPTLHGNFVPLARIEHEGMMVMVVNVYSPDGEKWTASVDDTPFIKEGAATPSEALTGLLEYIKDHKIPVEELNKLGIYSNTTTIGNNGKYSMINVQVAVRFEDIAMQGGEEEGPTLDVLFVFFNVKDINGELVPHFMIPSLNNDNDYIMEEGHDDPVSLVKKALGDYKLSEGDMEYLGWKGDTPPNLTREDINNMVKIDDRWVSVTRKVPKKLIVRD